eukprot:scaffold11430_cov134-Isochrysis_galbana.AAC.2
MSLVPFVSTTGSWRDVSHRSAPSGCSMMYLYAYSPGGSSSTTAHSARRVNPPFSRGMRSAHLLKVPDRRSGPAAASGHEGEAGGECSRWEWMPRCAAQTPQPPAAAALATVSAPTAAAEPAARAAAQSALGAAAASADRWPPSARPPSSRCVRSSPRRRPPEVSLLFAANAADSPLPE